METVLMTRIIVRPQSAADRTAVRAVLEAAFGRAAEAGLVEALYVHGGANVALVAELDGRVVGQIMFSPVTGIGPKALCLAPMAVEPAYQRRGIGTALVEQGLAACRAGGWEVVVVLGHPDYYPRFGFVPAGGKGIRCEYEAPEEAFMVLELQDGTLQGRRGVVRFRAEFGEV